VISSFSAAFGGGGIVFLLLGILKNNTLLSLSDVFYAYSGLVACCGLQGLLVQQSEPIPVGTVLEFQSAWPPGFYPVETKDERKEEFEAAAEVGPQEITLHIGTETKSEEAEVGVRDCGVILMTCEMSRAEVVKSLEIEIQSKREDVSVEGGSKDVSVEGGSKDVSVEGGSKDATSCKEKEKEEKQKKKDELLWRQLRGPEFWCLLFFFSFVLLAIQFYVATVEIQLEIRGDEDHFYTQLFNLLFSLGGLATPLSGYLLDVHGFYATFGLCSVCFIIGSLVNLISDSLELQIVVFVAMTLARFLLFASFFSYVPATFGFGTFGTILGAISVSAALVGLLQTALTTLTMENLDGNYDPVNSGILVLACLTFSYPVWLSVSPEPVSPTLATGKPAAGDPPVDIDTVDNAISTGLSTKGRP